MPLEILTFPAGPAVTNAYLVADTATKEALIIDAPAGATADVLAAAQARGWTVTRVVITHTHWDHVADAAALQAAVDAPLLAHPQAVAVLKQETPPIGNPPIPVPPVTPDATIDEGDTLQLGQTRFAVLHLPGHEPYHLALWSKPDGVLLSGDVLFPNGHGRTDLPGSDQAVMDATLRRMVKELPSETVVYPGHGAPTTIGAESAWINR